MRISASVLRSGLLLFVVVGMLTVALADIAEGEHHDLYASDPWGLIAFYDSTTERGMASEVYEVWACHITGGPYKVNSVSPEMLVQELGDHISQYWQIQSDDRYQVSLVVGGTVQVELGVQGTAEDRASECRQPVRKRSGNTATGALIVTTDSLFPPAGSGGPPSVYGDVERGMPCNIVRTEPWCKYTYPANKRDIIAIYSNIPSLLPVLLHEMGHALGFPHSYTGLLPDDHKRREYDNPMDIMSGGGDVSFAKAEQDSDATSYPLVGMVAVNRYAAGWIPPNQVRVYQGGTVHLALEDRGQGTLMLAIPSEQEGLWLSVAARRTTSGYDYAPTEGVEVYVVDQRPIACNKQGEACWGVNRLVTPYPLNPSNPPTHVLDPPAHMLNLGDQITWGGITISVGPTRNSVVIRQWWIPPYGYPYSY